MSSRGTLRRRNSDGQYPMMKMQSRVGRGTLVGMAGLVGFSLSGAAFATALITFADEDLAVGSFNVTNQVTTFALSQPFLCGSTGTPATNAANKIDVTFPGANPGQGNFLFGALSSSAQVPQPGLGAWTFSPASGLVIGTSDPTLVCYSLDATGARKMTPDLFLDTFETPDPDASVRISVAQLPTAANFYSYQYFIDVAIPVVSTTQATSFRLRDGYDSSVFTPNTYYCDVPAGTTSCPGATTSGNVDVAIPVPANTAYRRRFIVQRQIPNTATLPSSGAPLVLSALFGPPGLERRLDNNVAQGFAAISDMAPVVNTSATDLSGISEGQSKLGVSFTVTDDTSEQPGQLLGATVSIDFNGTTVSGPADCTTVSGSAPMSAPVTRTCTFDVVTPSANFATDGATAGTFANGVSASVNIVATDRLGQASAPASLPLHVASADNDAPVFTLFATAVPDPQNNNMPTITCSLADTLTQPCLGSFSDSFVTGVAPGPADAADELASQRAIMVLNSSGMQGGNTYCSLDANSAQIFGLNGGPKLARDSVVNANFNLTYALSGSVGSAKCTVVMIDGDTFPAGQSAKVTQKDFRIVVTN